MGRDSPNKSPSRVVSAGEEEHQLSYMQGCDQANHLTEFMENNVIARSQRRLRYPTAGYISAVRSTVSRGWEMENVSRRGLLRNGSLAVVGVGLVAVPAGLKPKAADASAADRPSASQSAALPAGASLDGPLVAHVKDLRTGEIGVYLGTSEVTFRDPHLAAKLYRAVG
jgi:hypothetical protein